MTPAIGSCTCVPRVASDSDDVHTAGMTLKNAALLGMIGTILMTALPVGTFILTPTPATPISHEQCVVAVALADQLGATIATQGSGG